MRGRDIFISCDYEYCDAGELGEIHAPYGGTTYTELIAMARAEGWSIGKQDFCPGHRHLARRRVSKETDGRPPRMSPAPPQ